MFMGRRTKRLETLRTSSSITELFRSRNYGDPLRRDRRRGQVSESQVPVSRESHPRRQQTPDGFATVITKQKSEDFPDFDKRSLESKESWKKYLDEFNRFWEEHPVTHRRGSDRIATPTPEELRASGNASDSHSDAGPASGDLEFSAVELSPERISDVFSDTAPGAQ